ncbi:hypothetical protein DYI24_01085 [Rhodopseudomonas sp. BR0C11]|uniref:hypothetical protein n=1 Tax=Rhodopseudomonas sp. BR0C11 TaxID=2269370 RepID=UPI0013DF9F24|nr:hypothetical protein [Rhodopseudomonas sp. BR0C11]NEV75639.1 hypothetical protein [Rhodopseudomonas sp. BR0C11]
MISGIFVAFNMLSAGTRFAIIGGVLVSLVVGYGAWRHSIYREGYTAGYQRAISDVGRNNQQAVGNAKRIREQVTRCESQGLAWDQTTGGCR